MDEARCPRCGQSLAPGLEGSHLLRCSGKWGVPERIIWPADALAEHRRVLDALEASQAEMRRLRKALKMEYELVLDIYKENHNTGDIPRTWWRERAKHMAAALDGGPQ